MTKINVNNFWLTRCDSMSDWKEIEDCNQDCSESNGWCGFCWRCKERADWLHKMDEWERLEKYEWDQD